MSMQLPGYTIIKPVAEGGMASVYLAMQDSLQRKVALKILKNVDNEAQTQRFLSEGKIIASLEHPNIITIYDIGVHASWRYIAMAYHAGGDLETWIATGIGAQRTLAIVAALADSLAYVHGRGIIHRDVKPANVLFARDGSPVLTDFGVAKEQRQDLGLTRDGMAVGSPYYLSPEQAQGLEVDDRADIYGLGIVFYEMLTGVKPFQGETVLDTLIAHVKHPIPALPEALARCQPVLERMLAKRPKDRYRSAAELSEQLQALARVESLGGAPSRRVGPIAERPETLGDAGSSACQFPVQRSIKGARRRFAVPGRFRRTVPLLAALGASVAIGVFSLLALQSSDGQPAQAQAPMAPGASAAAGEPVVVVNTRPAAPQPQPVTPAPSPSGPLAPELEAARLLVLAERASAEDRLTLPAQDSAYHYYRQILALIPRHEQARAGLAELVDIYTGRAQREIESLHYKRARQFIARGLLIDPSDQELLALSQQSYAVKHAPKQLARNVKGFFKKTF